MATASKEEMLRGISDQTFTFLNSMPDTMKSAWPQRLLTLITTKGGTCSPVAFSEIYDVTGMCDESVPARDCEGTEPAIRPKLKSAAKAAAMDHVRKLVKKDIRTLRRVFPSTFLYTLPKNDTGTKFTVGSSVRALWFGTPMTDPPQLKRALVQRAHAADEYQPEWYLVSYVHGPDSQSLGITVKHTMFPDGDLGVQVQFYIELFSF